MDKPQVSVSPALVAALCLFLYIDTYGFVLPFLTAALLHEAAHLLVLYCLKIPVAVIRIRLSGAVIAASFQRGREEALTAAAGPLMNLILALVFRQVQPAFCLMNLVLLAYNLLPVYPLDGGRLCKILFCSLFGARRGTVLFCAFSILTILSIVLFCLYATVVKHFGMLPCFFAALLVMRLPIIPCQMPAKLLQWRKHRAAR